MKRMMIRYAGRIRSLLSDGVQEPLPDGVLRPEGRGRTLPVYSCRKPLLCGWRRALPVVLAGGLLWGGCTREADEYPTDHGGVTASVVLQRAPAQTELAYALYVFATPAGTTDYRLAEVHAPVRSEDVLRFGLDELSTSDYRFLFTAFPVEGPALAVQADGGIAPGTGLAWDGLRIVRLNQTSLTPDHYFAVTDMTGAQVLSSGKVAGSLTRMVGQWDCEFFRSDANVLSPVSVVSADVASVLDRVTQVEVRYAGTVSAVQFDLSGTMHPAAYDADTVYITVPVSLDASLRAVMPQAEAGLTAAYDAARGSVRLAGEYLLPSPGSLRVKMLFTYYDDTPACGNADGGAHTAGCFRQRQLTLLLPASATGTLPVDADRMTVCRAGLKCDRIIDALQGTDMTISTDWN